MGRHRAQDRPPGGVDRPGIAWWDDREDPAAGLSAALRGWATPGEGGRTPEPAPAAEVRQPGSLVMSLLVCCRLVM